MALGLDGWASLLPLFGFELLLVFVLFRSIQKEKSNWPENFDRRVKDVTG